MKTNTIDQSRDGKDFSLLATQNLIFEHDQIHTAERTRSRANTICCAKLSYNAILPVERASAVLSPKNDKSLSRVGDSIIVTNTFEP